MSDILFMARLTDEGDFVAVNRAERLLKKHGFSVGAMQKPEPRGIMHGDIDIQKWRNLNREEREALHGLMSGNRSSQVSIEILDTAPIEPVRALADSLEGQPNTIILFRPPAL
ncbi:hypothetical protein [Brucella tritici]|uniref:hypothetical protein n=1 Tax=Brucella tritici TaxID=94626 RepID=UPI001AD6B638|nr:hypothetical protein [Brucella tritici]